MSERKHTSSSRSERREPHRSHRSSNQAASEDDAYRRARDDVNIGPPPSYHTRAEVQVATGLNSGRPSSERQCEARARSQYDGSRSQVFEHDDAQCYSASAKQRKTSTTDDDENRQANPSQGTKVSIRDRISGIFGKGKQSSSPERLDSSSSYRSVPLWPSIAGSEAGSEQRRSRSSRIDDRLNRGMGRLDALKEEESDGSIADLEPGEIRQLMAPSASVQSWIDCVPLTEHAVATFNSRPQPGRMRAQSETPVSKRRMMSHKRAPLSIAPGESAFSTVEPYDQAPRLQPQRAESAGPTYHITHVPTRSEAPSFRTVDLHKEIHGSTIQYPEADMQDCKEQDRIDNAIKESLKDLVITASGHSKIVEKASSRSEAQGWNEDEINAAIERSICDTRTSQRGDDKASHERNNSLSSHRLEQDLAAHRRKEDNEAARRRQDADSQRREAEVDARTKKDAENAIRRVQEVTDAARRQKDAEDTERRWRNAEDAARRKRESDEADGRHEARLREMKHAAKLEKQAIAEQEREAEHAARMRELELADKARELASIARARDAASARKVREEEIALQKQIAEEQKRLADERSRLEDEKQKLEERIEDRHHVMERTSSDQRASGSLADMSLPPYSPYDCIASTDRSAYRQPPQSIIIAPALANHTPQGIYTPSATNPHALTVHSHITVTQPAPSSQPPMIQPPPHTRSPQPASQTPHTSTSTGEIYRPPRRTGHIMPDTVTRIQQHYRFRRSLIDRNVQEGRRTPGQGRTAIVCLNRNEVADIDSQPRRTQELNVIGLEAFEADIELLDRLGGDQMAPPVPWAIPSLEAESHGNYNQVHLREHIERLMAQQDGNTTASGRISSFGLTSVGSGRGRNSSGGMMSGGNDQYYEWYEEYHHYG